VPESFTSMQQIVCQKADSKDVDKIIRLLDHASPLPDALRDELYKHIVLLELKKGEMLITEGETCRYMYFIVKGTLIANSNDAGFSSRSTFLQRF
jgi:CRP-like cAMP-binding protein